MREFVTGVVLIPSALSFLWFSAFDGAALHVQLFEHANLVGALDQGYDTVLFALFNYLPLSQLMAIAALILLIVFFVTSGDSAVLILASMSTPRAGDPSWTRKLVWGVAVALIAGGLLGAGVLEALEGVIVVVALPFALLLEVFMGVARMHCLHDAGRTQPVRVLVENDGDHRAEDRRCVFDIPSKGIKREMPDFIVACQSMDEIRRVIPGHKRSGNSPLGMLATRWVTSCASESRQVCWAKMMGQIRRLKRRNWEGFDHLFKLSFMNGI